MIGGRENSRPELHDVTLVAATSVAMSATIEALEASMRQARFAEVLLLSDRAPPAGTDRAISWREIDPIASRGDYSRFMLRDLSEQIGTNYALCVQWDGFVLDGGRWDPKFLHYDYIGAVWPQFHDGHAVGNGGFSLRSRRLLDACRTLPDNRVDAEDIVICRLCRPRLEQMGITFAPENVAKNFAYERTVPEGGEFGFHGAFNLVRLLPAANSLRLFKSLESGMLARKERLEILRWASAHGRIRLALEMLRRLT